MAQQIASLVWLRRDLRLSDHAALAHALKQGGQIQPVFIFDTEILARFPNPEDQRLSFIAETLCQLDTELRARGGSLLVLHGNPELLIPTVAQALGVAQVVAGADFEPSSKMRDQAVADALEPQIRLMRVKDHLIHQPQDVLKDDGTAYKVFTPYSKAWLAKLTHAHLAERVVEDKGRYAINARATLEKADLPVLKPEQGARAMLEAIGYKEADISLWRPEDAAPRLKRFLSSTMREYATARDYMAEAGTSRISPYLRFGLVSIRECARAAHESPYGGVWLKELIWREFYAMILHHYPQTVNEEFQTQYIGRLQWRNDATQIEAWKEGRTGYPVVDAAMRQLRVEGWMHNRARMVVASFFTKHLLADWRIGEEHFAQWLMDYEQASNVGGWQWAASTGTDAQPYFRVFNPTTQGERFDPKGEYIRRYVSELADIPVKTIHQPGAQGSYPAPIVEHKAAREAAIACFKELR
jgi:deoxyribodipyrimidine photo-lyase